MDPGRSRYRPWICSNPREITVSQGDSESGWYREIHLAPEAEGLQGLFA